MVEIPAHPRLARLLLEGARQGLSDEAATLAALIQEGRLEALNALELPLQPDEATLRAKRQLLSALPPIEKKKAHPGGLGYAVLAGFPDRVGRRRDSGTARVRVGESEIVFASGGSGQTPRQRVAPSP